MEKSPGFFFYVADWLDLKVLRMSLAAQGAYFRLLCHMWKDSQDQCSIEKNVIVIRSLLGVSLEETETILDEIQWENDPIFIEKDGRLVSKRLQSVKNEQVTKRRVKSKAGIKGMQMRYQNHNKTVSHPLTKPNLSVAVAVADSNSEVVQLANALKLNEKQIKDIRIEVSKALGHKVFSESNENMTIELFKKMIVYSKKKKITAGYIINSAKNLREDLKK